MREPVKHIARDPLPWRSAEDNDTECGKPIAEFANVIGAEEALAIIKEHGVQRAAFVLCMTCLQTAHRWWSGTDGFATFLGSPTERLSREYGKRREQLDAELRTFAELAARHKEEFDDLVEGRVVPIGELQRMRQTRKRGRR